MSPNSVFEQITMSCVIHKDNCNKTIENLKSVSKIGFHL